MRQNMKNFLAVLSCSLFLATAAARAQVVFVPVPDVTVSAGYSYLQTQRANNLFYDHSGAYVDADFKWTLPLIVPLQVGIGATGSGYDKRESIDGFSNDEFSNDDFYDSRDHLYSDLGLFELEPRIGVHLGGWRGFFAEPRIGAGAAGQLLWNRSVIQQ